MSEDQVAYAIKGEERALARSVAPELFRFDGSFDASNVLDADGKQHLVAAVVATWSGDCTRAYAGFRRATATALATGSFDVAVGALERFAHHALLFGDVALAQDAIADAVALAGRQKITESSSPVFATAARLAMDTGDVEGATRLVANAVSHHAGVLPISCAPIGVALAIEGGDATALRFWSGPPVIDAALHAIAINEAAAATLALLIAGAQGPPDSRAALALRRVLLAITDAQNVPELFAAAARYGDLDEARYAVRVFEGCVYPQRRYLQAHRLLAHAYLAFRTAQYARCSESAGDAARAFSAMGLRRWTDEAMALLVRHAGSGGHPRGKLRSALTQREEQIANLIRRGARNREIASALQISEHTVERHVSSILGRLGLRSRWQIADTRPLSED